MVAEVAVAALRVAGAAADKDTKDNLLWIIAG